MKRRDFNKNLIGLAAFFGIGAKPLEQNNGGWHIFLIDIRRERLILKAKDVVSFYINNGIQSYIKLTTITDTLYKYNIIVGEFISFNWVDQATEYNGSGHIEAVHLRNNGEAVLEIQSEGSIIESNAKSLEQIKREHLRR